MTIRKLRVALCCGLLAFSAAACSSGSQPAVSVPPPAGQAGAGAAQQQPADAASDPASSAPASPDANAGAQDLTPTAWGPIGPADKKLLSLVQQTSLREITTSQRALQVSNNPMVKMAAQVIIDQHKDLEAKDAQISAELGLPLPDKPAPDMQVGIDRMANETGEAFDKDFANTLRQAHAQALILISTVRADTRNDVVRSFADLANDYIKNHCAQLEKTGDVDYDQLPVPTVDPN